MTGPQFVVHESWGYPIPGSNPGQRSGRKAAPGLTVTVHDSARLFRVVGLFRSEYPRGTLDERIAGARDRAQALADRLNGATS